MDIRPFSRYLSLIKFSHTIFALPFAFVAFFLATSKEAYDFSLKTLLLIVICMVSARSAAMAFNRYADRRFDAINPRTSERELPSGKVSSRGALWFTIISMVIFIIAAGLINRVTLILSPVALIITLGYSYTKRFTALCHFILGLGLALAPAGAYIAVTETIGILPLIYSAIVLTWVAGFDIIYSLQDEIFDRDNGLLSIPSSYGRRTALTVSAASHTVTALLVVAAGLVQTAGYLYIAGAIIFLLLLTVQHLIVTPGNISRVNMAFGKLNGPGGVLYGALTIADIMVPLQ